MIASGVQRLSQWVYSLLLMQERDSLINNNNICSWIRLAEKFPSLIHLVTFQVVNSLQVILLCVQPPQHGIMAHDLEHRPLATGHRQKESNIPAL